MRAAITLLASLFAFVALTPQDARADACASIAEKLAAKRKEYRSLIEENGWWGSTSKASPRSKAAYEVNAEHLPPVKRGKMPLPDDAEGLYSKAIPDPAAEGTTWWARDSAGNFHRFQGGARGPNNELIVHWNGSTAPTKVGTSIPLDRVPGYIKKRYGLRDEIIKLVDDLAEAMASGK